MQMSSIQFFAYVEGINVDRYVHGNNCDRALEGLNVEYRISAAVELPGEGGGKSRLVAYYEHLRGGSSLVTDFKGKATVVAFFMDKDIDDRTGLAVSSDHVFYTEFYDVENHVFHEGDVAKAVSAGCSLPPNWCRGEFGKRGEWQQSAAARWKEWVRLCFTAKVLGLSGEANYGRPSPINGKPHSASDPDLTSAYERKSHAAARSASISCANWNAVRAEVDASYATGAWDKTFKGKWYGHILQSQVLANCPDKVDEKHLQSVLVMQVAATMTFDSPWAISTQDKIRNLLSVSGVIDDLP
ncbi:hypothetical protein ACIBTP_21095 [Streptomyces avidinii]|uniref:hypothetical protein n=1 Tax=Streptomyces avidinii TaxID=1895 RepID=UPI0037B14D7E